ncbi:hypothetical protein HUT18_32175 [Streptomyces sp. NA04227]|uniref:hypothetical protein n=1 Tax=Streptomyces sp. NA04227 TaxID=2742136 RepID=UPI0015929035|nr:hypothetical protein [Streptomyces sp. NA04227]QKW10379.1 hypothetical protein HUT18_32175 [Streptomyces sp. NA04227]
MSVALLAGCGGGEADGGGASGRDKGAGPSGSTAVEPAKKRRQALYDVRTAVGLIAEGVRVVPKPEWKTPCEVEVVGYVTEAPGRSDFQRVVDRLTELGWRSGKVEAMEEPGPQNPAYVSFVRSGKWSLIVGSSRIPQQLKDKVPGYEGFIRISGSAASCDLYTPPARPTGKPPERPNLDGLMSG